MKFTFGLAGTTEKTITCAEALVESDRFDCSWVLTPGPQPVGRKKIITQNPVHTWAEKNQLPHHLVEKKIDEKAQGWIEKQPQVNFLVVIDFGYLIPTWLLETPEIKPINVHPSALPAWRGSSPGQFSLLYGDKNSAVTIMIMNQGLDEGPILWQESFEIRPGWTQTEYYQHAIQLAAKALPGVLEKLADGGLAPQPQPDKSPTPTARQLKKADAFVSWELLQKLLVGEIMQPGKTSELLQTAQQETQTSWPQMVEQAARALYPWPVLWTTVPTNKGEKRMKILSCSVQENCLVLEKVQIEGQQPAVWNQVKNIVDNEK